MDYALHVTVILFLGGAYALHILFEA